MPVPDCPMAVMFQPDFVPLVSITEKFVIVVLTVWDLPLSVTPVNVGSFGAIVNSNAALAASARSPSRRAIAIEQMIAGRSPPCTTNPSASLRLEGFVRPPYAAAQQQPCRSERVE